MACGSEGFDDAHGVCFFVFVEGDEVEELAEDNGAELGVCLFDVVAVYGFGRGAGNDAPSIGLEGCLASKQSLAGG